MSDKKKFIRSVAIGLLVGMAASVLLICLLSAILSKSGLLPNEVIDWVTAATLAIGALAGGFTAAKLNRGAGLIAGAAAGAAMLFALVLAAALRGEAAFTLLFPIKLAATLLGASAGGILAVRRS